MTAVSDRERRQSRKAADTARKQTMREQRETRQGTVFEVTGQWPEELQEREKEAHDGT